MADDFKLGDYYMICDRTGFKVRASEIKREYTGALVRQQSFEPRHPQDFVRSRKETAGVKVSRPPGIPRFTGPLTTTIAASAVPGALTVTVDEGARFFAGDHLAIALDNKEEFRCILQEIDGESFLLSAPLPDSVSIGCMVWNYSAVSGPNLG